MTELAWDAIVGGLIRDRTRKPRDRGLTMVIDTGVGERRLLDTLEQAAAFIDHWKFAFGTSVFLPRPLLQRKLGLLADHGILSLPGGTLLEVALVEHHCRDYMKHAKDLGFSAIEISDGTIPMPAVRRRNIIACARDAGLVPISEVGKKDPRAQPSAEQMAEQALTDIEHGAEWVVMEARESGRAVGIYDEHGQVIDDTLTTLCALLGDATSRLIWEAPLAAQQTALIRRFGTNVGLGNVPADQILAVECLRCRLRFDTLHWVTDELLRTGAWDPARIEPKQDETPVKLNVHRS
ncbi:phosphosulfolactate synthase [Methylotetracoccus oryzae]|uniref:phosphosulfolactate synthase n=1 Tax=Methylotetracoccus oryzae TaxID=1919059 RepID=UPI00111B71EB|nr:phosphosulfolactate synthase [Methylotetracoccus oryzae]